MNIDYQIITLGLIATAGFAYNTYEGRKRKKVVRKFCDETVPNFVERANIMIDELHQGLDMLIEKIDGGGGR